MTPLEAKQILKALVSDGVSVFFTRHAETRMTERNITRLQVFKCLEYGYFEEEPAQDVRGAWCMRLRVMSAGESIAVALALDIDEHGNYAVIITVMR